VVETGLLLGLSTGQDPRRLHQAIGDPRACRGRSCQNRKAGAVQAPAYQNL